MRAWEEQRAEGRVLDGGCRSCVPAGQVFSCSQVSNMMISSLWQFIGRSGFRMRDGLQVGCFSLVCALRNAILRHI